MVLSHQTIRALAADTQVPLISDFAESCLEGASYDMRLGPEYARGGKKGRLTEADPTLKIGIGEFVLLTSLEVLRLPNAIVGHNGIMSPWAKRGIVSLFSPQIDPGFQGVLVVPVFNAGDAPVSISLGEKIFTVEFQEMDAPAEKGWSERFGVQSGIGNLLTPAVSRPGSLELAPIEQKIVALQQDNTSRLLNLGPG